MTISKDEVERARLRSEEKYIIGVFSFSFDTQPMDTKIVYEDDIAGILCKKTAFPITG